MSGGNQLFAEAISSATTQRAWSGRPTPLQHRTNTGPMHSASIEPTLGPRHRSNIGRPTQAQRLFKMR